MFRPRSNGHSCSAGVTAVRSSVSDRLSAGGASDGFADGDVMVQRAVRVL